MDLIKVDHTEYGLEENKAKQISAMFKPMLDKMVELEDKANEVFGMPLGPEAFERARELRLEYKKTRTGTAKIHKDLKAFYLQGGRFVDGWKKAQEMASYGMEDRLAAIENHEAIEKQRQIDELQEKRAKSLHKYNVEVIPENLGEMDKITWDNYLTGTKFNFENKKKRERKEREEQLERERVEALRTQRRNELSPYHGFIAYEDTDELGKMKEADYQKLLKKGKDAKEKKRQDDERIRQENERLRKEHEKTYARQKALADIGLVYNGHEFCYKDVNVHWTEAITMSDDEFAEVVKKCKNRMDVIKKEEETQARKEEDERRKEREEKERVDKELKDRKETEEREKREEEERKERELNADDSTKVDNLIKDLSLLASKYTFKSKKNKDMYANVGILLGKVVKYIQQ